MVIVTVVVVVGGVKMVAAAVRGGAGGVGFAAEGLQWRKNGGCSLKLKIS